LAVDSGGNIYVAGTSNATWGSLESIYTSGKMALLLRSVVALSNDVMRSETVLRKKHLEFTMTGYPASLQGKVEEQVRERGWTREYSRNLVLRNVSERYGPFLYGDHTGVHNQFIWHARIENRRQA
jgi:hypothetical protein